MAEERPPNSAVFGRAIPLFSLFGFRVSIDLTWLILGLLITWSLAVAFFPSRYPHLAQATYWWMGLGGAVGVFVSIVLHEFSHSLVARWYGLPIRGITLFIFGGVAQMSEEPASPKVEFLMSAAGPLASVVLALLFWGLHALGSGAGWPVPATGLLLYLSYLNGLLALFNLVPAFPLDGGRMFRAALWRWRNLRSATRIASNVGSAFGLLLIALGILAALQGNLVGGIWWLLIGIFLRNAASMSYRQVLLRQTLEGEPVRRFMSAPVVSVPPDLSLERFVQEYVYKYRFTTFPVVEDGRLRGWVRSHDGKQLGAAPAAHTVGEICAPAQESNTIDAGADAVQALARMNETGNARLMVTEQGRVVGIIAIRDLIEFLTLRMDLEGDGR